MREALATGAADAERLVAAAERAGTVAAVPFVYRYHPLVRELRSRALAGEFGNWQLLHGSYLQDWMLDPDASGWRVDPRAGGDSRAFADIGSHWCDLVEWVTGERFTELTAHRTVTVPERPSGTDAKSFSASGSSVEGERSTVTTEDAAALLLRTESGALASTVVSQVSAGRKNRLWFELDGSAGSAVFDQETPDTLWLGGEDSSRILHRGAEAPLPSSSASTSSRPATHKATSTASPRSSPTSTRPSPPARHPKGSRSSPTDCAPPASSTPS